MNKARQAIWDKSGGKCWYCGCDLPEKWHADHYKPIVRKLERVKGKFVSAGYHQPENSTNDNVVPSCPSCNILKHSRTLEQFREIIGNFVNSLNRYDNQYKFAKKFGLVQETDAEVKFWFEKEK